MNLANVIPMWRASMRAAGLADRSIKRYIRLVEGFIAVNPDLTVQELSQKQINRHGIRLGQDTSSRTVGLFYSAIRSFCGVCIDAEIRDDDPTLRIRYPKRSKNLPRPLTRDQITCLLHVLRQPVGLTPAYDFYWRRNRLIIYVMLYAGLRISEVANLRWMDINGGVLTVRGGKGAKDRSIPIHPDLAHELADERVRRGDMLACHYRGDPMSAKSMCHLFDRWVPKELDLDFTFSAHQLRHSFATYMVAGGANIMAVKDLMGHEDVKTTQQYLELDASHLSPAVNILNF